MGRWRWALVVVWVATLYVLSSYVVTVPQLAAAVGPILGMTPTEFENLWTQIWWLVVKGWHMAEFGLLFGLVYWVARHKLGPSKAEKLGLAIAGLAAIADEIHQTTVPARGGRVSDILIDWMGIAVVSFWIRQPDGKKRALSLCVVVIALYTLANHPFGYLG